MKEPSADFQAYEEASKRRPAELFHIWFGTTHYRYTSGDITVTYDSNDYTPATIKRDKIKFDNELQVKTCNVTFSRVTEPLTEYIAQNPVGIVWIEILKIHRDQDPLEAGILFIGLFAGTQIAGVSLSVRCVDLNHFLTQKIPILRYQPHCNNALFDSRCALSSETYKVDVASVTVSADGLTVTSSAFGAYDDGYFDRGKLVAGDYKRHIVSHVGNNLTLKYKVPGFATGDPVSAYPGCDLDVVTCYNKYGNVNNFFGFPWIPQDNPVIWGIV